MPEPAHNPALTRFAWFTTAATLFLIGIGGLVTSHGAGMAVPDWPNTYGYNMFFFPISQWIGGIFYEHTHRLVASFVGLLVTVLALWLYGTKSRPWLKWGGGIFVLAGIAVCWLAPHKWADGVLVGGIGVASFVSSFFWPGAAPAPGWLRRLGLIAFVAVVLQGVLGGLRVTLYRDELGVFHGTVAQLFLALVAAIALFTTSWWRTSGPSRKPAALKLRRLFLIATGLMIAQLILGTMMRHQHAGLAIPDFPLAHGKLWPALDADSVAAYNQARMEVKWSNPITAFQIVLQMAHRLVALLICVVVAVCVWRVYKWLGWGVALTRLTIGWAVLLFSQVLLGAATIWTGKSADIATAHVIVGAASLMIGALLCIITGRAAAEPARDSVVKPAKAVFGPAAAAN